MDPADSRFLVTRILPKDCLIPSGIAATADAFMLAAIQGNYGVTLELAKSTKWNPNLGTLNWAVNANQSEIIKVILSRLVPNSVELQEPLSIAKQKKYNRLVDMIELWKLKQQNHQ